MEKQASRTPRSAGRPPARRGRSTVWSPRHGRHARDGPAAVRPLQARRRQGPLPHWEFSSDVAELGSGPGTGPGRQAAGRRAVPTRGFPTSEPPLVNNITHWGYGVLAGAQSGLRGRVAHRVTRVGYGALFGAGVWARELRRPAGRRALPADLGVRRAHAGQGSQRITSSTGSPPRRCSGCSRGDVGIRPRPSSTARARRRPTGAAVRRRRRGRHVEGIRACAASTGCRATR